MPWPDGQPLPLHASFMSELIQIMRTGQLYKLDMADAALKDAQVPHFTREETASGMRVAMPAAPSMGPGIWWAILVPEERAEEARSILSELPFEITTAPDVWDCLPEGRNRKMWRKCIIVYTIAFFALILYEIVSAILHTL